ncbi:MAG: aminotransferase class I/II-fold pyridoxal phosphate-dependent enzyme [Dehalococcoidales bacterium]|nr:aminotransferase class I/II-fold pyridoxal phosphate-dependent enzyme [Dehalococcoidales bacterium]
MKTIELRSDTKTLPTEEMRRAMYEAEVGDDESGEDPTVNRLEQIAAEMLGKEAALLTSSGVMSNLIAVLTHAKRGDEILVGDQSHIYAFEKGETVLAGTIVSTMQNGPDGRIDLNTIEETIRTRNARYHSATLLSLENTHNLCSGNPLTPEYTAAAADIAHQYNLKVHIDGARIFNASVALGVPVSELVGPADTVCFCLSKGLSCPVGSVLCGTAEFIQSARRWRQMLGGQMRQAGYIAAAGIVALNTMIDRLAEDHANARRLALGLANIPGIIIDPELVRTNIVFFEPPSRVPAAELVKKMDTQGVKTYSITVAGRAMIRAVTNRMVAAEDIDEALHRIASIITR